MKDIDPREVFQIAIFSLGMDLDPDRIFYYLKSEYDKGTAWVNVCKKAPQHLWRKCHSKHYWAWVAIDED